MVKNPPWRPGFDPWVGKISWRRAWQPTPVFLPGEFLWTEEPGRPQLMGSQRVGTTEQLSTAWHSTRDLRCFLPCDFVVFNFIKEKRQH